MVRGRWWLLVLLSAGACALSGSAVAAGSPRIEAERARERQVRLEIQAINIDLGRAAEAWDGARYRLGVLTSKERTVRLLLREAQRSAKVADARRGRLLVALYESDPASPVDVLVGATSMDDLITRLDNEQRLASEAAKVVKQVGAARSRVRRQERELAGEIAQQRRLTAQLSARRTTIARELGQRQRLLSSIRTEIGVLKAQKAAEERKLAREARIRLARQVAAARRAARVAARERARRAARIRAARIAARVQARRAAQVRAAARARERVADHAQKAVPDSAPPATTTSTPKVPDPPTTTQPPPAPPAPPATVPTAPLPAPSAGGNLRVVSIALRYLGVPYRWGGASPQTGFDCSGLVMYVFAQIGVSLPHFAAAQYQHGSPVARDQLEPGDLVFFDNLNHVGIYIGDGQFVHAPHTGDVVRVSNLAEDWFSTHYVGARRLT